MSHARFETLDAAIQNELSTIDEAMKKIHADFATAFKGGVDGVDRAQLVCEAVWLKVQGIIASLNSYNPISGVGSYDAMINQIEPANEITNKLTKEFNSLRDDLKKITREYIFSNQKKILKDPKYHGSTVPLQYSIESYFSKSDKSLKDYDQFDVKDQFFSWEKIDAKKIELFFDAIDLFKVLALQKIYLMRAQLVLNVVTAEVYQRTMGDSLKKFEQTIIGYDTEFKTKIGNVGFSSQAKKLLEQESVTPVNDLKSVERHPAIQELNQSLAELSAFEVRVGNVVDNFIVRHHREVDSSLAGNLESLVGVFLSSEVECLAAEFQCGRDLMSGVTDRINKLGNTYYIASKKNAWTAAAKTAGQVFSRDTVFSDDIECKEERKTLIAAKVNLQKLVLAKEKAALEDSPLLIALKHSIDAKKEELGALKQQCIDKLSGSKKPNASVKKLVAASSANNLVPKQGFILQHAGKIIGFGTGSTVGAIIGGFVGFFLMPVTFGLSIPLFAAIGAAVGGFIIGGAAGVSIGAAVDNRSASSAEQAEQKVTGRSSCFSVLSRLSTASCVRTQEKNAALSSASSANLQKPEQSQQSTVADSVVIESSLAITGIFATDIAQFKNELENISENERIAWAAKQFAGKYNRLRYLYDNSALKDLIIKVELYEFERELLTVPKDQYLTYAAQLLDGKYKGLTLIAIQDQPDQLKNIIDAVKEYKNKYPSETQNNGWLSYMGSFIPHRSS